MANLNAAFSELRQALQTVDRTWEQLAAQNAIHSWPHGASPGQLLRGAMVALQNGVVGVVAAGAEFAVENPADRGDPSSPAFWPANEQ